jgi:uncharacterized OB-fold protein
MFNLIIDKDSREFWDGAKKNKLMIQKCKVTGICFLYSRGHSGINANSEYEWIESSGKGSIYSYTISHIPGGSKYYLDKTPYIIGSILLEEGVRITSNIISNNFNDIQIGSKVFVEYVKLDESIVFPCFKLV